VFTTIPRDGIRRRAKVRFIRRAFAKIVKRIRKTWPPFDYFAVVEFTKRDAAHLHVLTRGTYIDQAWLSRNWEQLTGAHRVDIQRIPQGKKEVLHVTKYVLKTAAWVARTGAGFKPVSMSAGWLPPDWHKQDTADSPRKFLGFFKLPGRAVFAFLDRAGVQATPCTWMRGALALKARGPPDRDALDQALELGAPGVRTLAAVLLSAVLP
ncbi:unnamed protein product, partial [marine sediment metagenome]